MSGSRKVGGWAVVALLASAAASAREVRVTGFSFDPIAAGEPRIAEELRAAPQADAALRLVQLDGVPRDAWILALEAAGLRLIQYYPHDSYLVWADAAAMARAEALPFVRWQGDFHPAYKLDRALAGRQGRIDDVVALVFDPQDGEAPWAALPAGVGLVSDTRATADGSQRLVEVSAPAEALATLARMERVIWLGYRSPERHIDDEMSDQIVAGNYVAGEPFPGYFAHLASLGVDGSGVVWAVSDTGVDWDHPDLADHIVGGLSPDGSSCAPPAQPGSDCAGGGHGTHVAGILAGDATAGFVDGAGYLYGLGVAPEVGIFALNVFSNISLQDATKEALLGGAVGSNNSWSTTGVAGVGYVADAALEDRLVRDGNLDTPAVAEPFIQVFSAGNSGPGASTITEPKEAKNIISVANSFNRRAGSIDSISASSSRGPAIDGRVLPTLTAPGSTIASSRNDLGGSCATAIAGTNNLYAFCSGTSMASPHVAGAVALLTQWWKEHHSGAAPSAAMAKALLVNSAVDMGTPDIPNNNEGWGRIDVTRAIRPGVAVHHFDQRVTFGDTGEQWQTTLTVNDPSKPLKVTLAWSDAPGAAGANPALVNDLDLTVVHDGETYRGNAFSNGWSTTGGSADALNNVENVYLQSPVAGDVTVIVTATAIAGDGVPYVGDATDQDFALVCSNCELFNDGFESSDTSAWSSTSP